MAGSGRHSDPVELARRTERQQFVARCPHFFLVREPVPGGVPAVFAIRKVQVSFARMITVGRTPNQDIVIDDPQISALHAFFQTGERGLEIVDAGSRTGTYVGAHPLVPEQAERVVSGDPIRFGRLQLRLVDAGECWELLHRMEPRDG